VLAASGNDMFAQLGDVVAEVLTGRTAHHLMPHEPDPQAVRLHAEVAQAIATGDAERAETAMREIVVQAMCELGEMTRA
jgi:DNA-binding FadR family transcriptional regulator